MLAFKCESWQTIECCTFNWKKSKYEKSTAVKDHMLFCDHILSIDDFKTLATGDSDFHVTVKDITQ